MLDVVLFEEFEEFLVSSDVAHQPAIVPHLVGVVERRLFITTADREGREVHVDRPDLVT